jgi:hypothetical protein
MRKARQIALTGMLVALATVIMSLGGMIPLATFCCPMLAGMMLVPVFVECGEKMSWAAYIAMALLGLMLCPDKEAAFLLVFLGHYPVLRWRLEQIRGRWLRILVKLAVFNIAIALTYGVLLWVLQMDALLQEYREAGIIMTGFTLLLGNITLLMYDRVLAVATRIYVDKMRGKLL